MQAVSPILVSITGLILSSALVSCRSTEGTDSAERGAAISPAQSMKIPVGTVHVVRAEQGFVLIQSSRFLALEEGTDLTVVRNGAVDSARLRVSPARKGQFVTADIVSGVPQNGDQVLMDYSARSPAADAVGAPSDSDEIQVLE